MTGTGEAAGIDKPSRLLGLLSRKERWGLSFRGGCVLFIFFAVAVAVAGWKVYPFLAVSHRVNGEFLIVEGWVSRSALRWAIAEFRSAPYQRMLCTGGPRNAGDLDIEDTFAHAAVRRLKRLDMSPDLMEAVPSTMEKRDRTFSSALALRRWFAKNHVSAKAINIVTVGPHARRTRLLFEKALGGEVSVGIIAVEDTEYDSRHWWKYSAGVREVIGESIAYLYAKFFFSPELE
jgi:hypothetical protein